MGKKEDADDYYLDSIEAEKEDNIEDALSAAKKAVKIDPEHADAWWMISTLSLPKKDSPSLSQASLSLSACKQVIKLNPNNADAWVRGGRILADELGMYEVALEWWNDCREYAPNDPAPIIEQVAILADLGLYKQAINELSTAWHDSVEGLTPSQTHRVARLHSIINKASEQDSNEHFKPWEKNHEGWDEIRTRMHRGPANESLLFLMLVGPFLLLEVYLSKGLANQGWTGFIFTTLILLGTCIFGIRWARKVSAKLNRPAFHIIRATDVETTSGKIVVPDDIRKSKLYGFLMSHRSPAYQKRHSLIVESGEKMRNNWKLKIPEFNRMLEEE